MTKALVISLVALGVVLPLLGLLSVSAHSARSLPAGPEHFSDAVDSKRAPAGRAPNRAQPVPGVTLTH